MTSDPLERIGLLLDEATRERNRLRDQKVAADNEVHLLRRRLKVVEDGYREANDLNADLKRQLETAEQRAEDSRRAMLDHAART